MKLFKRIKHFALKNLEHITNIINQLPDRNSKVRQSPYYQEVSFLKKETSVPVDPSVPNSRFDRKAKGPRHSSTRIYNQPREIS